MLYLFRPRTEPGTECITIEWLKEEGLSSPLHLPRPPLFLIPHPRGPQKFGRNLAGVMELSSLIGYVFVCRDCCFTWEF